MGDVAAPTGSEHTRSAVFLGFLHLFGDVWVWTARAIHMQPFEGGVRCLRSQRPTEPYIASLASHS